MATKEIPQVFLSLPLIVIPRRTHRLKEALSVGAFVEILQRINTKGTLSQPKQILSKTSERRYITVPGKKDSKNTVAIEDVRKKLRENEPSLFQMELIKLTKKYTKK